MESICTFACKIGSFTTDHKHFLLTIKTFTTMKSLGYIGAFLGGAIAGAAIGLLAAPESGKDTRSKLTGAVKDFCDKHDIKLTRKQVEELVEDVQAADAE